MIYSLTRITLALLLSPVNDLLNRPWHALGRSIYHSLEDASYVLSPVRLCWLPSLKSMQSNVLPPNDDNESYFLWDKVTLFFIFSEPKNLFNAEQNLLDLWGSWQCAVQRNSSWVLQKWSSSFAEKILLLKVRLYSVSNKKQLCFMKKEHLQFWWTS